MESLDQDKDSRMERNVGEEGLLAAEKGGQIKTEGEEGLTSPHPTRNDLGNPASNSTAHMARIAESTHYAGATVTDLEDQSPLLQKGEGAPPQPSQRDGVESLPQCLALSTSTTPCLTVSNNKRAHCLT